MKWRCRCPSWCIWWSSNEIRMWCSLASLSAAVITMSSQLVGGWELASFLLLPVWSTLLLGPCYLAIKYPWLVIGASVALFAGSTWWMETYPIECRRRWKDRLLFDTTWTPDKLGLALSLHRNRLLPGVPRDELVRWLDLHGLGFDGTSDDSDSADTPDEFTCASAIGNSSDGPKTMTEVARLLGDRDFQAHKNSVVPIIEPKALRLSPKAFSVGESVQGLVGTKWFDATVEAILGPNRYSLAYDKPYIAKRSSEFRIRSSAEIRRKEAAGVESLPGASSTAFLHTSPIAKGSLQQVQKTSAVAAAVEPWSPRSTTSSGTVVPEADPSAAGLEAPALMVHTPRLDDVEDFNLRAYCACHRYDSSTTFPGVYIFFEPPRHIFGTRLHRLLHGTCSAWTCTFTEQNTRDTWAYYVTVFITLLLNLAHWRGFGDFSEYWLGAGVYRWWWLWFWAMFLPVWSVMFITRVKGCSVQDYVTELWSQCGQIILSTQNLMTIIVVILLFGLGYSTKERIYKAFGIDDRNIVHWLNVSSVAQRRSWRTVQLCIWCIECNSGHAKKDIASWEVIGTRDLLLQPELLEDNSNRSIRNNRSASPLSFFSFHCGARNAQHMYSPVDGLADPSRDLTFSSGSPNLFVRVAFGHNEVQNTRVQRLRQKLHGFDVVSIQENFKLTASGDKETTLNVELADQGLIGYTERGRAVISEATIMKECQRSENLEDLMRSNGKNLRSDSIAVEQLCRMLDGPTSNFNNDEDQQHQERRHMYLGGFKPYELSEGGAIWLAFADITESNDEWNCVTM